jgi:5-methylcytosine-specific restriction endonuclease McrA
MRGQGVSSLQWFVCEVCGIQYQRRVCVGEASRYCSVKCKGKAQTQRSLDSHPHYTCQHCGNRFFDIRHPSEKTFCSRECSFAFKASKCKGCGKRLAPKAMSEWCVDCKERVCPICGKMFSGRIGKLTCSDECRLQYGKQDARRYYAARKPLKQRICKECGQTFVPEYGDKRRGFCSDACSHRHNGRIGKTFRRARLHTDDAEAVNPMAVFARDKWRCHLCGARTPRKLRGTYDDRAPELDHITPLARGGAHTYVNTACACRRCNQEKGDSMVGQLRMIG